MQVIINSPKMVSDLVGAHDTGDFATEVKSVSATSPPLTRGAILCLTPNGDVTLGGAELTIPDNAFGILLDGYIDPTVEGGATCSCARNGVFDATALYCDPSLKVKDFEGVLKQNNILLEKVALTPA